MSDSQQPSNACEMLLAVDVGNTHTVAGLFPIHSKPNDDPTVRWHWQTQPTATSDELSTTVFQMLSLGNYSRSALKKIVISSVVPQLTHDWHIMASKTVGEDNTLLVAPGLRTGIRIATSEPHEVGSDRIVNAVAAWEKYNSPCIVVDLGTATTLDVIANNATYVGGVISPGVMTCVGALVKHAARLSSVDLYLPNKAIGRNTADSMRSGTMFGTVAQLEGMLTRIRSELVSDYEVDPDSYVPAIATGGISRQLGNAVIGLDDVDPDLTLRGLQLLALHR